MNNFTSPYSWWYLLLLFIVAVAVSALLYYKEKQFSKSWHKYLLFGLRTLSLFLIGLLLLRPQWKFFKEELHPASIVIAEDMSESIPLKTDASLLENTNEKLSQLADVLKEDYTTQHWQFGEETMPFTEREYNQKKTNISTTLKKIRDQYEDQFLGGIVIATDGIFNEGINPEYTDLETSPPLYIIGLGDSTIIKDLFIKQIFHNELAYQGDKLLVEVDIQANKLRGKSSTVALQRFDGKQWQTISSKSMTINANSDFRSISFELDASKAGNNRFRIKCSNVENEAYTRNNVKEFYIDVIKGKQKILILGQAPHPDFSAIKTALETEKNYQVETAVLKNNLRRLDSFDLVILHQLPASGTSFDALWKQIEQKQIPRLFIIGERSNMTKFNGLQNEVSIRPKSKEWNDVSGIVNSDFNHFQIEDDVAKAMPSLGPVRVPFADFDYDQSKDVFAFQEIGSIKTKMPLILLPNKRDKPTGVLLGEGWWRWRLYDHIINGSGERFDQLFVKIAQFLSKKADKRQFKVRLPQKTMAERDRIVFSGELYNNNYELINEPEVKLTIRDKSGNQYPYVFNREGNAYRLDAGFLPPQSYSYKATTNYQGKNYVEKGSFVIEKIELEAYNLQANHDLLRSMAERTGGQFFLPEEAGNIEAVIKNSDRMKPTLDSQLQTESILNWRTLLFIIGLLLFLEWFLRRYFGSL